MQATDKYTGWLLDIFENPGGGICCWFIGEDGTRRRFLQEFPVEFFISGDRSQLQAVAERIKMERVDTSQKLTERYDLFTRQLRPVLAIKVQNAYIQPGLFRKILNEFPDLDYFDADIPLSLRHAAIYDSFPLAYCRVTHDGERIVQISILETPWDIDHPSPPLRILRLEPDEDPQKASPKQLFAEFGEHTYRFSLYPRRALLINLKSILTRYDPDIIQTRWGDTWLLPELIKISKELRIDIQLSRETGRPFARRKQRSYFSYGHIIYRGQQILLFGRAHIDSTNAMFWKDYELEGIFETARVTRLSIQQAARQSSGTGISSMQVIKALELKALVPYQKQQTEDLKTALELLQFDQGGLVYQPLVGLHKNVGEIDFISMYPSIMVRCNISPETDPTFSLETSDEPPGLIPQTLGPLLKKRIRLKERLGNLPGWSPERARYKQQASAHKWLLVTCFGYLGYKNARFGRIEAHEAITANGREALLRAKEAAEELGFLVLHMYVDGIWVQRDEKNHPADFQSLIEKIAEYTGLPVSLNGIYRWVAFLPSRVDERIPVPNRYFGVFQDGSIKMRGIEARRHDTPNFISNAQLDILEHLAEAKDDESLVSQFLPGAIAILRYYLEKLRKGHYDLEDLSVAHRLSKELDAYQVLTASARAYKQLVKYGKTLQPGQRIRFLYTRDEVGVFAWDLPEHISPGQIDTGHYRMLLLQAAETILQPFGWSFDLLQTATGKIPAVQGVLLNHIGQSKSPFGSIFDSRGDLKTPLKLDAQQPSS